ncbi:MAG: helix-turn-helix transcriptional regulator [Planctomycetota bacterium]|jgi:predicted ArsR family transcriptional regulator
MGPTRQTILDLLKRRGQATARELAAVLKVTAPAVRQHLTALERDGLVAANPVKRPMGRPVRVYALAPAAAPHFPTAYGPLALDLLRLLKKTSGAKAVEKILTKRRKQLLASYRKRLRTAKGSKLEILAKIRDEEGYVAELSPTDAAPGGSELVEHHCPIRGVADEFPEVCRQEQLLFEEVLGKKVERLEHMVDGGLRCRYVFAQPGKKAAKKAKKKPKKAAKKPKKAAKKKPAKKAKKKAKKRPAKKAKPRKAKKPAQPSKKAKKRPAKKTAKKKAAKRPRRR